MWIRNHRGTIAILSIGALFAAARGGKVYTSMASVGYSDYTARLAANRAAVLFMCLYILVVFLLPFAWKALRHKS